MTMAINGNAYTFSNVTLSVNGLTIDGVKTIDYTALPGDAPIPPLHCEAMGYFMDGKYAKRRRQWSSAKKRRLNSRIRKRLERAVARLYGVKVRDVKLMRR